MEKKMKILVANDDGIDAPGLRALVKRLAREYDVFVCAPNGERSSMSHAVTYWRLDNEAYQRKVNGAIEAWAVDGTPADCVYYGLNVFWKGQIDAVVSGINRGENLNADVPYSGTVGAAMEGLMLGVPSMAVSLCSFTSDQFETCAEVASLLLKRYLADRNRLSYVCSVNVPPVSYGQLRGVRITCFDHFKSYADKQVTMEKVKDHVILHCHPAAPLYEKKPLADGDRNAVEQGYVSVTPVGMDMVRHDIREKMYSWNDIAF